MTANLNCYLSNHTTPNHVVIARLSADIGIHAQVGDLIEHENTIYEILNRSWRSKSDSIDLYLHVIAAKPKGDKE